MKTGFEIYDSASRLLFDGEDVMYLIESGALAPLGTFFQGPRRVDIRAAEEAAAGYPNTSQPYYSPTPHETYTAWWNSSTYPFPKVYGPDDILFSQIPASGILQMCSLDMRLSDFTSPGRAFFVGLGTGVSAPNYRVFSPTPPPNPAGTHGVQLYRPNGAVFWDSRHDLLGVEPIVVTAAQCEDVLLNDASYDFTLPAPMPNAYVSSPFWASGRETSSVPVGNRMVKITQPASDTIRISRAEVGAGSWSGTPSNIFLDALLLVSRA